ncbi:MAG TPA: GGDEF domain-containing protein [Polyangiaceae bacterium]|nr:GGDEF domain-containing protein [Polyangiaceae bacterium]
MNLGGSRIAPVIRQVTWVGVGAHAVFVPLFLLLGQPLLAGFNVFGICCWMGARVMNGRGRSSVAMWLLAGEVVGQTVLAVSLLGWASGFQYYLVPLVPFVMFNERLRGTNALLVSAAVLLVFVGLYELGPAPQLAPGVNHALSLMNSVLSFVGLALITFHFRNASMAVERQVAEMAVTDPLTGLYNRRHMNQRLREEESRSARTLAPFSVILVDIDHFKRINDTSGHDVGDRVLEDLARLLRDTVRTQDIVARWGGEEFLVVLPQTPLKGALDVAERLRFAAEATLARSLEGVDAVTLTLGAAEYAGSVPECLKRADVALYRGKEAGRNRVVSVTPEHPRAATGA